MKTASIILFLALMFPGFGDAGEILTIQAEQARIKTVGGMQRGAWTLWSNGDWGDYLSFTEPGSFTVRVQCYGSPMSGTWPVMAFSVDGVIRETVTVATNQATEYVFPFKAETRAYRITVSFLNDELTPTEDRNLYIASFSLEPSDNQAVPTLTTETAWRTRWSQEQVNQENELLARTNSTRIACGNSSIMSPRGSTGDGTSRSGENRIMASPTRCLRGARNITSA